MTIGTMLSPHEQDIFGLRVAKSSHKDIRRIKRNNEATSIHGNKYWRASTLLIDYLREFPLPRQSRVLELGCGWGLSGIYCAKFFDADVTSLDADSAVFPFTEYHAALNGVDVQCVERNYEDLRSKDLRAYDVVIGADICFWDNMTDLLYSVLRHAARAHCSRIVLSDPGRPPFRILCSRAEKALQAVVTDWHSNHPYNTSGIVLDIDV